MSDPSDPTGIDGFRLPFVGAVKPLAALWCGFLVFAVWTMVVLGLASQTGERFVFSDGNPLEGRLSTLLLCGGSLLLGWCWLLSAGLAYLVKPDGAAVRSFWRWAVLTGTLLITAYEVHGSRVLWPVYLFSFALMQSALLEFFLLFPQRVRVLQRFPFVRVLVRLLDPLLVLLFGLRFALEGIWVPLFVPILTGISTGSVILTVGVTAWRVFGSSGRQRSQVLTAAVSVLPLHILFLLTLYVPKLCSPSFLFVALPCGFGGAFKLVHSMLRQDLWDSEVVVPGTGLRSLLVSVMSFIGGLLAVIVLRSLTTVPVAGQVLISLMLFSISGPLHGFIGGFLGSRLFPAGALYRPTVDDLIVRFTDLRTRSAVIEMVEQTVLSTIACERAKLLSVSSPIRRKSGNLQRLREDGGSQADPGQSSNVPLMTVPETLGESGKTLARLTQRAIRRALRGIGVEQLDPNQIEALCSGQLVYVASERGMRSTSPGLWEWLLVPTRFREQVIGVLAVSPKQRGPLFSSLDQELLLTIAHQAALALANAIALEELDDLRRAEHSAHRERLDRAISTIAAEIAHEIRFPINFFRMLVERQERDLQQKKQLTEKDWAEDLDIGKEEVARLERMADRLRKMALSRTVQPRPLSLRAMTEHVRLLLADRLIAHAFKSELQDGIELLADPDALIQILLNLLANAIDACSEMGSLGLTSVSDPDGRLRIVVWDNGPGFSTSVAQIFEPWFTTKPQGTGLGLAITHRLVRAHGWEIVAERRGEHTCFDVIIPVGEWRFCPTGEISLIESTSSDERHKSSL